MGGGLFEGFEESVEGFTGEHVDLIDDIDFEFPARGGVRNAVAQILDLADAAVGGAVNFEDVQAAALLDFLADILVGVEVGLGTGGAVEGFGEDAGGGGFADAAGADKEKGVGEAALGDGVGERANDVFLADELRKGAGTVFSGED